MLQIASTKGRIGKQENSFTRTNNTRALMTATLEKLENGKSDLLNLEHGTCLATEVSRAIDQARVVEEPFFHLEFDRVFPQEVYNSILAAMPNAGEYRPMSGRSKSYDATPTRVKIDLFPEYIRHFSADKRPVWESIGRALCSEEVKQAFMRKLAPGLQKRFGEKHSTVGMFPIPILTRDISGYSILPHTDTHWKGITVQLYLAPDEAHTNIGTIFHTKLPDGSKPKARQMRFAPNTGYAFAVHTDTWHSADKVGPEVKTRDSILLTYFVDQGPLRFLRNRAKRVGNFFRNEFKYLTGQAS
jgi:hypothetical protein